MIEAPEPTDKLDAPASVAANGPEDGYLAWRAIDWRACEASVRRLRQRIFTASQAGDLKRVRNLQKLMLRSRANTLLSVRRVTERNAGRKTAGVDGEVALTPEAKLRLAERVQRGTEPFKAQPVKRVYTLCRPLPLRPLVARFSLLLRVPESQVAGVERSQMGRSVPAEALAKHPVQRLSRKVPKRKPRS